MVRFVLRSLEIAGMAALIGLISAPVPTRAQNGFIDDSSHVPPSPSTSPVSQASLKVFAPQPAMVSPAQATAPPVSMAPRMTTTTTTKPAPRPSTPVGPAISNFQPSQTKVGPFGVGGRVPKSDSSRRSPTPLPTPNPSANPIAQASSVTGTTSGSSVQTASHIDEPSLDPSLNQESVLSKLPTRSSGPVTSPYPNLPMDRLRHPTIMGAHLGLNPGETATERSFRLMETIGQREQEIAALRQQNEELAQTIKYRDEQLLLAIREIRTARKDVAGSRDELEHLRKQVKALQDKVFDAERDNAALLQTMAPLLQRLLDSDETAANLEEEPPQ